MVFSNFELGKAAADKMYQLLGDNQQLDEFMMQYEKKMRRFRQGPPLYVHELPQSFFEPYGDNPRGRYKDRILRELWDDENGLVNGPHNHLKVDNCSVINLKQIYKVIFLLIKFI
jgi:hypothetical protein